MTHKSDDDFLKHIFQHLSQVGLHILAGAGEEGEMESLLDVGIALSLVCSLSSGDIPVSFAAGGRRDAAWASVGLCRKVLTSLWAHTMGAQLRALL